MGSSTLRGEEVSVIAFQSLTTIIVFLLSLFYRISSFCLSEENAVMPSASLQNASGSSPPCYFCAPSLSDSEAPVTPVLRPCSPYSFLFSGTELGMWIVEGQCTLEESWYQYVLGGGLVMRCFGVRSPCYTSQILQKLI